MLIATLAFAISLSGVADTTELVPANQEALTIDLEIDGYRNGYMDRERMMTYDGCTLERDAAYTYALLMEAASRDGIYLEPIDCYRTYNEQKAAWNRRCPYTDQPIYEKDPITGEKFEVGSRSIRICTGPPTAQAGRSNHGWGRAVDFGDGNGTLGCRDRAFIWLQSNAQLFGWVHPPWAHCGRKTQEPWHWEYAGLVEASLLPIAQVNPDLVAVME
jgi:LAS superfamily LD-carboxypeptidase LdcB